MAENKKSFLLYVDLIHTVRKMSKQKAGELFMTILSYVNDENPVVNDTIIDLVFEPIKQQLKRDLRRWEDFKKKQADNGKLGGRPKTQKKPKNPSLFSETQKSPNVNVNVNDTVNVNDINNKEWFLIKKNFLEDGPWQFKFITEKKISLELLEQKQKEFITDLDLKEDYKPPRDLKNHFTNWYNQQKKSNGTNKVGTSAARIETARKW